MSKLSHLDDDGAARMVDVSGKDTTEREAAAEAVVVLSKDAYAAAKDGNGPKGDVLGPARIAGIMAAKKTPELIPLCHTLALARVDVDFAWLDETSALRITAFVKTSGQTGVEMEALTAVSVAALTIYDMTKAIDKGAVIEGIRLTAKSGGKSGAYRATARKAAPPRNVTRPKVLMGEVTGPRADPNAQREAFRKFMTANRLRATEWAKQAGVPAAQIFSYLTGRSALSGDTAERLARAARVRVEDLFR